MKNVLWLVPVALLVGCAEDGAEKFVGSWSYAAEAKAAVSCGGMTFDNPLGTIVETFVASDGGLVKSDSQGCAGLKFSVSGNLASLNGAGQSCSIPAAGMSPAATFAPTTYTFTISGDGKTLTQALTAKYTPTGGTACDVTAVSNTLTKK